MFQHTAARRRLPNSSCAWLEGVWFQHTAARRRLQYQSFINNTPSVVSTHSRPKAAATRNNACQYLRSGFNTQPPEGGCFNCVRLMLGMPGFNTQPPEGGCHFILSMTTRDKCFNTQPPEGGCHHIPSMLACLSCFNTQPPEGGCLLVCIIEENNSFVSTHSRPKAAAKT